MKMKNALIVNGGLNSTKRDQLGNYDLVVAVDSGTEQAYKLFLKPDLIIGDLDSIDEKTIQRAEKDKVQILKYKTNKNETDFELALKHVLDKEIKDITIIGGEYGEIDHLFSVLTVIISFQEDQQISWIHKDQTVLIPSSKKIAIGNNVEFSILPFSNLKNLNISGAQWNLENENIEFGKSITLRNISVNNDIEVSVEDGKFCLIYNN